MANSRISLVSLTSAHRRTHPFSAFAKWVASTAGHPISFAFAVLFVIAWALSGPYFEYSTNWQLIVNTGTTIATFLMVFLIQNSQNRDATAIQIKLDELIRSDGDAHNSLIDLEELTEKELVMIREKYEALARKARSALRKGKKDKGIPPI